MAESKFITQLLNSRLRQFAYNGVFPAYPVPTLPLYGGWSLHFNRSISPPKLSTKPSSLSCCQVEIQTPFLDNLFMFSCFLLLVFFLFLFSCSSSSSSSYSFPNIICALPTVRVESFLPIFSESTEILPFPPGIPSLQNSLSNPPFYSPYHLVPNVLHFATFSGIPALFLITIPHLCLNTFIYFVYR